MAKYKYVCSKCSSFTNVATDIQCEYSTYQLCYSCMSSWSIEFTRKDAGTGGKFSRVFSQWLNSGNVVEHNRRELPDGYF